MGESGDDAAPVFVIRKLMRGRLDYAGIVIGLIQYIGEFLHPRIVSAHR